MVQKIDWKIFWKVCGEETHSHVKTAPRRKAMEELWRMTTNIAQIHCSSQKILHVAPSIRSAGMASTWTYLKWMSIQRQQATLVDHLKKKWKKHLEGQWIVSYLLTGIETNPYLQTCIIMHHLNILMHKSWYFRGLPGYQSMLRGIAKLSGQFQTEAVKMRLVRLKFIVQLVVDSMAVESVEFKDDCLRACLRSYLRGKSCAGVEHRPKDNVRLRWIIAAMFLCYICSWRGNYM